MHGLTGYDLLVDEDKCAVSVVMRFRTERDFKRCTRRSPEYRPWLPRACDRPSLHRSVGDQGGVVPVPGPWGAGWWNAARGFVSRGPDATGDDTTRPVSWGGGERVEKAEKTRL